MPDWLIQAAKHLLIASPAILAAVVFIVISMRAVHRVRREAKIRKAECDRRRAESER